MSGHELGQSSLISFLSTLKERQFAGQSPTPSKQGFTA
jgi:hypothetical protein